MTLTSDLPVHTHTSMLMNMHTHVHSPCWQRGQGKHSRQHLRRQSLRIIKAACLEPPVFFCAIASHEKFWGLFVLSVLPNKPLIIFLFHKEIQSTLFVFVTEHFLH